MREAIAVLQASPRADVRGLDRTYARVHNDMLIQAAGLGIGSWATFPASPVDILAAALLANSVTHLDLTVLTQWITTGGQRANSAARYRADAGFQRRALGVVWTSRAL